MYKLVDEEVEKSDIGECTLGDSTGMRELRAHLYRLQRLMLALLPKFQPSSKGDIDQQNFSYVQIGANILLYARNQMQHSHMNQKLRHVLFEPYLSQRPDNRDIRIKEASSGMYLGVVVEHLVSATNLLQYELSQKRSTSVKEMSSSDLKKVCISNNFFKKACASISN
jgi:hypothetical protein